MGKDEQADLRERLESYRGLLRKTTDQRAKTAIVDAIKELETRLHGKRLGRRFPDGDDR